MAKITILKPRPELWRIVAPHFVAGLNVSRRDGKVIRAAPVIRYMMGWDKPRFIRYCMKKSWKMERVDGI